MFQKFLFAVLSVIAVSIPALAQESIGDLDFQETKKISQGWRLGLIRAQTEQTFKANPLGEGPIEITNKSTLAGIGLSYADLPINQIGFVAGFAFLNAEQPYRSSLVRADINVGSAINNYLSAKMGGNVTYSTSNEISNAGRGVGLGYNAGLGLKMNQVFSAELNYISMGQQSFIGSGIDASPQQGFEAQLLATF